MRDPYSSISRQLLQDRDCSWGREALTGSERRCIAHLVSESVGRPGKFGSAGCPEAHSQTQELESKRGSTLRLLREFFIYHSPCVNK
jgi:hypothetical protein